MRLSTRLVVLAAAALAATALTSAPASASGRPDPTTDVRIIGFNDFHGNLEPPSGSSGRVVLSNGTTVDAGGAAYLATHVKQLRSQVRNSLVVSAGDNIGASPLTSALFHDEPTIDFLNEIGVTASVVGNHEFDEGYKELQRMQFGGCHPTDGCQFDKKFKGANFPFLGANVTFDNGLPALLPFSVKFVDGVPLGIIGVTLKDLPSVVTPEAIKGLKFGDEVQAIDRTANLLDFFGVKAQIVLMHQGDNTEVEGPDDCKLRPGPAAVIAQTATSKVDAFFTGHSHQQYNCVINDPSGQPRPVIQSSSFGRLLSVVDLKLDKRSRDVVRSQTKAHNEIVTRDVTPDPAVAALVADAKAKSGPIANRQIGTITADLPAAGNGLRVDALEQQRLGVFGAEADDVFAGTRIDSVDLVEPSPYSMLASATRRSSFTIAATRLPSTPSSSATMSTLRTSSGPESGTLTPSEGEYWIVRRLRARAWRSRSFRGRRGRRGRATR